jgi:hypothetical protein
MILMSVGQFTLRRYELVEIVVKSLVMLAECDAWCRANLEQTARNRILCEIQDNGALTDYIQGPDRAWVSFQVVALPPEDSVIVEVMTRFHEKVSVLDLMAWEALAWDDDYLTSLLSGPNSK